MKKSKIWLLILALTLGLASCAMGRSESVEAMEEFNGEFESMAPMAAEMPRTDISNKVYDEGAGISSDYATSSVDIERIVIKNASLSIVVEDPIDSIKTINEMAEKMGGFMVSSNSYKTTTSQGIEVPIANVTIRVPAEKLDKALNEIKALVEDEELDILSEDVSGQDVTSEVTDLESRLRNLQAAETQLLEIMENADTTEDVINIFRELTSIREEIEVIQGQVKYYRESASLSAINVYLQAKEALEPITIAGWKPGREVQKALQALVEGGKYLVNIIIWLVIFAVPLLAIIILPIYFIVKYFRKRKQKKGTGNPEEKSKEPKAKKK